MNNAMRRRFNTQIIAVTEPSTSKIKKGKDEQKTFLEYTYTKNFSRLQSFSIFHLSFITHYAFFPVDVYPNISHPFFIPLRIIFDE